MTEQVIKYQQPRYLNVITNEMIHINAARDTSHEYYQLITCGYGDKDGTCYHANQCSGILMILIFLTIVMLIVGFINKYLSSKYNETFVCTINYTDPIANSSAYNCARYCRFNYVNYCSLDGSRIASQDELNSISSDLTIMIIFIIAGVLLLCSLPLWHYMCIYRCHVNDESRIWDASGYKANNIARTG